MQAIAEVVMAKWALDLENVRAGYGETVVLEDIRFALGASETVSIIGRNGVGKTTLLATIMGHTTLHGGRVALHDKDIAALATYRRVAAGLGYVPQEREIFPSLTLRENLEVAARPGSWTIQTVFELFPRLAERADNRGNQLSGGEQQMLAIGRALIGNPTVLLMDEPSEGLAPVIVEELARAVKRLTQSSGLAIVLVEQNTRLALDISPRAVVMDRGRIVYDRRQRSPAQGSGEARATHRCGKGVDHAGRRPCIAFHVGEGHRARMKRSTDRILTTHVGSLIRPQPLQEFLRAKQGGKPFDSKAYDNCLTESVAEVVRQQADAGIDVVSDGEFGKSISWSQYVLERLSGFERRPVKPGAQSVPARRRSRAICRVLCRARRPRRGCDDDATRFASDRSVIPGRPSSSATSTTSRLR